MSDAATPAVAPQVAPPAAPPPAPAPISEADAKAARKQSNRAWAASVANEIRDVPSSAEVVQAEVAAETSAVEPAATVEVEVQAPAEEPAKVDEPPAVEADQEPPIGVQDRIEIQKAWEILHKEGSKARQVKELLKKQKAEIDAHYAKNKAIIEEHAAITARLKDPAQRYRLMEEFGGSIGEWQGRAVAGDEPNPQINDLRKLIEERDAQWEARMQEIVGAQQQERVQTAIQSAEREFAEKLVSEATQLPHFKAAGADAVDRAYDFAENVARALKGRRDIPRSEMKWVNDYLRQVPKAVALDVSQLAAYFNSRLAREASVYVPRNQPEPQGQPTAKPSKADASGGKAHKGPLDNQAAAQRGAPAPAKDPSKMTTKEFAAHFADQIREED